MSTLLVIKTTTLQVDYSVRYGHNASSGSTHHGKILEKEVFRHVPAEIVVQNGHTRELFLMLEGLFLPSFQVPNGIACARAKRTRTVAN